MCCGESSCSVIKRSRRGFGVNTAKSEHIASVKRRIGLILHP